MLRNAVKTRAKTLSELQISCSVRRSYLAQISIPTKAAGFEETPAALIVGIPGRARSIDNDVINYTLIAYLCVIYTYVSAGFNRSSDRLALLVHNVTRPIENITSWSIRTILANNESLDRLIIGCRTFLSRHFDDRSCYRYWLFGGCTLRTWLRKGERRKQCAADKNGNWFLHIIPPR
jgi:hypothetical protein